MAVTDITKEAVGLDGYNLTDSDDFQATGLGDGNGVQFPHDSRILLVLKNDTGGAAEFTLKLKSFEGLAALSITPDDHTIEVADGKTHVVKLDDVFKNSDGNVVVECDVAGEVLAISH